MKRRKVLEIPLEFMGDLLNGAVLDPPLPDDAEVVDCYYDFPRQTMKFAVKSQTYPEVPEGALAQSMSCRLRRLLSNGTFEP